MERRFLYTLKHIMAVYARENRTRLNEDATYFRREVTLVQH